MKMVEVQKRSKILKWSKEIVVLKNKRSNIDYNIFLICIDFWSALVTYLVFIYILIGTLLAVTCPAVASVTSIRAVSMAWTT